MPYSISVPITRRTVTGRAYAPGLIRRARCSAVDIAGDRHLDQAAERYALAMDGARQARPEMAVPDVVPAVVPPGSQRQEGDDTPEDVDGHVRHRTPPRALGPSLPTLGA